MAGFAEKAVVSCHERNIQQVGRRHQDSIVEAYIEVIRQVESPGNEQFEDGPVAAEKRQTESKEGFYRQPGITDGEPPLADRAKYRAWSLIVNRERNYEGSLTIGVRPEQRNCCISILFVAKENLRNDRGVDD